MNNGTTFTPLFDEIGALDRRHRDRAIEPGCRLRRHRRTE
jgi:hypothetical protein